MAEKDSMAETTLNEIEQPHPGAPAANEPNEGYAHLVEPSHPSKQASEAGGAAPQEQQQPDRPRDIVAPDDNSLGATPKKAPAGHDGADPSSDSRSDEDDGDDGDVDGDDAKDSDQMGATHYLHKYHCTEREQTGCQCNGAPKRKSRHLDRGRKPINAARRVKFRRCKGAGDCPECEACKCPPYHALIRTFEESDVYGRVWTLPFTSLLRPDWLKKTSMAGSDVYGRVSTSMAGFLYTC